MSRNGGRLSQSEERRRQRTIHLGTEMEMISRFSNTNVYYVEKSSCKCPESTGRARDSLSDSVASSADKHQTSATANFWTPFSLTKPKAFGFFFSRAHTNCLTVYSDIAAETNYYSYLEEELYC